MICKWLIRWCRDYLKQTLTPFLNKDASVKYLPIGYVSDSSVEQKL